MEFNYFNLKYACNVHDFIISETGGISGIKSIDLLESVISHIQNDDYYSSLEEKLTHLVFSIIKNHAFNDGNKRTSIALGAYFLEINGIDYCLDRFMIELENIVVYVADNKISKDLLGRIIWSIIWEDDFNEELKIEIITSIDLL